MRVTGVGNNLSLLGIHLTQVTPTYGGARGGARLTHEKTVVA